MRSFRARLLLIVILAQMVVVASVVWTGHQLTRETLTRQLALRATESGAALASALMGPVVQRDFASVQQILEEFSRLDGVVSASLHDAVGRLIARAEAGEIQEVSLVNVSSYSRALDSTGQIQGTLTLSFDNRFIVEAQRQWLYTSVWVSLGGLVLALLVTGGLVYQGTRGLAALTRASHRVRQGDFAAVADLPLGRQNEIGELAHAFEDMVVALRERIQKLEWSEARQSELLSTLTAQARTLDDALQAANTASEAKSRFLAVMSHEIRTPMNGVLGYIQLLELSQLADDQRSWVEGAHAAGETMLAVINDVLDYSRIEAGGFELGCDPFHPGNAIETVVRMLMPIAQRKHLILEFVRDPELPVVDGDALRLRQVATNLIGNALKFTDRGRVDVRLSQVQNKASANEALVDLLLEVADTGVGILPEARDRIFEAFVQVDGSSTRRFSGSGLGLAITRKIVESMGGSIEVDGALAGGSVFRVHVPMHKALLPVKEDEPLQWQSLSALSGVVLIVDDNRVNRDVLSAMARRFGLQCRTVENGQQAVASWEDGGVDLILMDWHMPVMDGLMATQAIRRHERARSLQPTPIIGVTANALPGDSDRCLEAGMDGYLEKPVSVDRLHAALKPYLGMAQADER